MDNLESQVEQNKRFKAAIEAGRGSPESRPARDPFRADVIEPLKELGTAEADNRSPGKIAATFLRMFDPTGRHNIVRLDPNEKHGPLGRTFDPDEFEKIAAYVDEWDGKSNIYFSVHEPREHAPDQRLAGYHIAKLRAVVGDVDLPGSNGVAELAELQSAIGAKLRDVGAPPVSYLLDSGGGLQFAWILPEKLDLDGRTDVEDAGRGVATLVGGDAVSDLARIMRLPGPQNLPTAKKRAKGRAARRATLLAQGERCSLKTLTVAVPPIAGPAIAMDADARIAALQAEFEKSPAFDVYLEKDWPAELAGRFTEALIGDPALAALWGGKRPEKGDGSGSSYRAALANRIGRLGWSAEDYVMLVRSWAFAVQVGDDPGVKLNERALARDWVRLALPVHPETVAAELEAERGALVAKWSAPAGDTVTGTVASPSGPETAADADAPVFIRDLNKRHAFVMDRGNAFVVNLEDGSEITFSRKAHFLDRYANRTVMNGKKESTQGEIWWTHDKRWQFLKGVDFDPNGVRPGVFNMWRGFPVLATQREWPRPEDGCPLILQHIREVVCAGDEKVVAYLLGWLAHMVQRPGEKPGVAVILKGRKGVGKDTLGDYVARFLGPYYVKVSHPSQLMGRFNAHLGGKLLIHAEELVWKNKSEEQSTLQSLITASEIAIEPKGVNIMMMKSQLRLIATSNAEHVVPASEDERRYLVLDVTDDKRGDRSWFGALRAEMGGDGPACLKRYLEGYPLEGFEVRDVPDTEALWRQKIASASPLDRWIQDELLGSDGTIWEEPDQPLVVSVEFLHSRYEKDTGRRNHAHVDKTVLTKHLQKVFRLGPSTQPRSHGRARVRTFPPREEARKLFEEHLGVRLDWP